MEFRRLLSSAPVGFATPDDVALKSLNGIGPATTSGPTGYTPQQIQQAYGFNQITFGNGVVGNGAGTTIAIVDAYDDPNITHDLHQFDLAFGLPDPSLTKVNETGGTALPTANSGWITEIALDVEWSHAMAPLANILLVEANTNSLADLMKAVNYARSVPGVVVVSLSWGSGEFSAETSFDSEFTTPAGHAGVSFVVSSGDSGSPDSFPAASPNVLSVGGTSLYLNQGDYSSESGWSGSGGGISFYESQPSYQNGIVTQSTTQRTNPDVAYDSNPSTGFPVYDSYNNGTVTPWGQWGGTSDAAPQWAALVAIADQGRALSGLASLDGASQLLPDLYQLPASDFHDITNGTSDGFPVYSAGPGYDLVTGRGTPVANLIVAGLTGTSKTDVPTHFSLATPATIISGTPFSLTVLALDASNNVCTSYQGTIRLTTTDLANGVVLPPSYSFTAADNGSHILTGITLISPGSQSIVVQDAATSAIAGTKIVTVVPVNSPPVLSGATPLTYVKNQSATVICPSLTLADPGYSTLSSATVTILNPTATEDILSFINNNPAQYGNVTGTYDNGTGCLTLISAGSTATLAQFQAALCAVTYFDKSGDEATLGTRSVAFQASNGTNSSNIVSSLITVSNDSTTTSISASAATFAFDQSVRLVAAVNVISPGQGIPSAGTGTSNVCFLDGSNTISGTVSYSVNNGELFAVLTTSTLSVGTHAITARYSGDANSFGSVSIPLKLTVAPAKTTCTVSSSVAWPYYGNPLTLTAVISAAGSSSGIPTAGTGTAVVTFRDGINVLAGSVTYSVLNGKLTASLTTSALTARMHLITAVYSGDTHFGGSISTPFIQPVFYAETSATISSSASSTNFGQPVTLTAVIGVATAGSGTPTAGTSTACVQFMDGTTVIAGTVTYRVVNGNLVATLTTSSLSVGFHQIKAVYSGDANFSACASAALKLQINTIKTTSGILMEEG